MIASWNFEKRFRFTDWAVVCVIFVSLSPFIAHVNPVCMDDSIAKMHECLQVYLSVAREVYGNGKANITTLCNWENLDKVYIDSGTMDCFEDVHEKCGDDAEYGSLLSNFVSGYKGILDYCAKYSATSMYCSNQAQQAGLVSFSSLIADLIPYKLFADDMASDATCAKLKDIMQRNLKQFSGGCSEDAKRKKLLATANNLFWSLSHIYSCKVAMTCRINGVLTFRCSSGQCLSSALVCDSKSDCGDSSDEAHCTENSLMIAHSNDSHCLPYTFSCKTPSDIKNVHKCIPITAVCDEQKDCRNDNDENTTICAATETACQARNMFFCSETCFPYSVVCDGKTQCADGEDEAQCTSPCPSNTFHCASGQECLSATLVCNGHAECEDSSDEGNCTQSLLETFD